jgi:hypothetical protein
MLFDSPKIDPTEIVRQLRSETDTDGNCLTVRQRVPSNRLDGMGESVPVVQESSYPALSLVRRNDVPLDLHTSSDSSRKIESQQILAGQEVIFRNLSEAATSLPVRESVEGIEIAHHSARLPEGPNEILSLREVDSSLSTDCCIHHSEQCRRDVKHSGSPMPDRRRETSDVSDESSADTDDEILPRQSD